MPLRSTGNGHPSYLFVLDPPAPPCLPVESMYAILRRLSTVQRAYCQSPSLQNRRKTNLACNDDDDDDHTLSALHHCCCITNSFHTTCCCCCCLIPARQKTPSDRKFPKTNAVRTHDSTLSFEGGECAVHLQCARYICAA